MSSAKDWTIRIGHVLDAIARIQAYTDGLTEKSFAADFKTQDAVVRNFEIIGEAVRHVPHEITKTHRDIPWRDMRNMRNVLTHRYEEVKVPTVWKTIQEDLPPLVPLLQKLLDEAS